MPMPINSPMNKYFQAFIPTSLAKALRSFNHFRTLGLLLLFLGLFAGGHKPPALIFRINVQTSGTGLGPTQALPLTLPKTQEMILVRAIPEVTEKNLRHVEVRNDGTLVLTFDHQGRVNLDVVTTSNQGRYLVVTIDGILVYSPLIDEEISSGTLVIPHPLPLPVVEALKQVADENSRDHKDSVVQ